MEIENHSTRLTLKDPNVQKIIEIAKEEVKKNRVIKIDKIYDIALKELDLQGRIIFEILHFLIDKKVLIEGAKHTRESILLNFYRKQIYRTVCNHKGVTFTFLREKVFPDSNGSPGQLLWHLKMLIKFRYIKKIKIGHYSVFMPSDLDEDFGKVHFFMEDCLNREIIKLFLRRELVRKPDIYKLINFKRENVNYRLKVLLKYKILIWKSKRTKLICLDLKVKKYLQQIFSK